MMLRYLVLASAFIVMSVASASWFVGNQTYSDNDNHENIIESVSKVEENVEPKKQEPKESIQRDINSRSNFPISVNEKDDAYQKPKENEPKSAENGLVKSSSTQATLMSGWGNTGSQVQTMYYGVFPSDLVKPNYLVLEQNMAPNNIAQ